MEDFQKRLAYFTSGYQQTIEAALQMCSYKKVFLNYAANLQENNHAKMRFQKSCKATLLKSLFSMSVNLQHIFTRPFPENTSGWLFLRLLSRIDEIHFNAK